MEVMISKCDQGWYLDRIGEVFNVVEHETDPLYYVREDSVTADVRYLIDKTDCKVINQPSIESRIQEALLSPGFIDKVAEAVMEKQNDNVMTAAMAADIKAPEPVIEYPYVGITKTGSIVLFTSEKENELTGIRLSGDEGPCTKIGVVDCSWNKEAFKPFNGTITYKDGKPVKTEEIK